MNLTNKENKWDIWEEPKDGSANGRWFNLNYQREQRHAEEVATIYRGATPYNTYEVRERNEA